MNLKKILRHISAAAVVIAAIYFFYLQFKNNADALSTYRFSINFYYISLAVFAGTIAWLAGPFVWRMYVNDYLRKKLGFSESFALYCTSTMFKYIPGKVWTYAAQIALMSSKGISGTLLIYINAACFVCLAFVSTAYALVYYLFYLGTTPREISVLIFVLLMSLDVIFIVWSDKITNYLIVPVNRIFKMEIEPVRTRRMIFVYIQIIYVFAFLFLGIGLYFLAKGFNMQIPAQNIPAIMATISISAIAGYLAFFSMGGLGVREGTMFFMLRQFSSIEAALVLPIAARLLSVIVEIIGVGIAVIVGMKYGYFSGLLESPREIITEEETINGDLQEAE